MPYTVILFVTRKSTLSPEEFKDHWENKHVPLLQSLTGSSFPLSFKRQYLARTDRQGFGGPANRDRPPLLLRGLPVDLDFDGVADMTWEDEKTFQDFYKAIHQSHAAAKLAKDEEQFLEPGKIKAVVVRETLETSR